MYVCGISGQWDGFFSENVSDPAIESFRDVRDLKNKHELIAKFKICLAISHGKVHLDRSRELSRNMN